MRAILILAALISLAWGADPFDTPAVANAAKKSGEYSPEHITSLVNAWYAAGLTPDVKTPAMTDATSKKERELIGDMTGINTQIAAMNANFKRWLKPENQTVPHVGQRIKSEIDETMKRVRAAEELGLIKLREKGAR